MDPVSLAPQADSPAYLQELRL